MKRRLVLLLILWSSFPALAAADVFEGQVASVDASQGTVAVRYRDPANQGVVERTFHIPPGQAPASIGVPTLNDVRVGDQVQITAQNQNGSWQVMSLVSNPGRLGPNSNVVIAGPALPAGAATASATGSTNDVFVASPRTAQTANGPFLPPQTTPPVSGTSTSMTSTTGSPFTGTFPTTTLSTGTGASGSTTGTAGTSGAGTSSANTGSTGGTTGASASGSAGGASGAS